MKKILLIALLLSVGTANAQYTKNSLTPKMALGVDVAQPYVISSNGNNISTRNNLNMGIDYRYFASDNINLGLRYSFDIEEQTGTSRQIALTPGFQFQWFQGQTWMPYVRVDLPVLLNNNKDMGFASGAGLAWNVGNQIGLNNLVLRYDFVLQYLFGLGNSFDTFSIEFFKFGLDYRF